jgi:ppGpp synthetase/RelA/SpoT-type nucleotidyltranferase
LKSYFPISYGDSLRLLLPSSSIALCDSPFYLADKATNLLFYPHMAWTKPEYPRSRVDAAGDVLISDSFDADRFIEAIEIINNWRASHAYPLQSIKMTLIGRARKLDKTALVAQRTKRIPAITLKLRTNSTMKLSKMHDIGGCRAVLASVGHVERLIKAYAQATAKNPRRGGEFVRQYDYISNPKANGYRSVHLVYKYYSDSRKLRVYNGLRIEIQLRSRLQHAWATAVETVDFFTGQALKSNVGDAEWKRFFALVSGAFALIEKRSPVPGVPSDEKILRSELLSRGSTEIDLLSGFQAATEMIDRKDGYFFLLELDSREMKIKVRSFKREELSVAQEKYVESEKINKDKAGMQTVLVSVGSFASLKKAYPNYFLDISEFLKHLTIWLQADRRQGMLPLS